MIGKYLSMAIVAAACTLGPGLGTLALAQQAAGPRVLVIPFTTLNVPDSQQWMAKGVQENLVADFGRSGAFVPVAFHGQVIVEDNATAVRLARQASANYVIRGAAQVVGGTVRLTAQLIDAKTGDTVNTASVTGSPEDLLKLEDELSAQLRAPAVAGGTPPASAPAPEAAAPQVIVVSQPSSPALGYDPAYSNGSYWNNGLYGYPGVIWPVVITVPKHRHPHRPDHCDPVPRPEPIPEPVPPYQGPIHRPRQPAGSGFGLPIPTTGGGFGLPLPQNRPAPAPAPVPQWNYPVPQRNVQPVQSVQWSASPAQSWHTPHVMPQAPRTFRTPPTPHTPRVNTPPLRSAPPPQPVLYKSNRGTIQFTPFR